MLQVPESTPCPSGTKRLDKNNDSNHSSSIAATSVHTELLFCPDGSRTFHIGGRCRTVRESRAELLALVC